MLLHCGPVRRTIQFTLFAIRVYTVCDNLNRVIPRLVPLSNRRLRCPHCSCASIAVVYILRNKAQVRTASSFNCHLQQTEMGVERATSSLFTRLFLLSIFAIITVRRGDAKDYRLGVLLPYSDNVVGNLESGVFSGTYYAAAVTLAVEKVNSDPRLLPGSKLSFVWNNTQCDQQQMVRQQRWQIQQGVSGFIGPICHGQKAAKIAAKHDLAVISFGSQEPRLSNKKLYPNFARTNPSNYKAVTKILELVEAKRWKHVTIMYQPDRFWKTIKRHLAHHLTRKGIKISRKIKMDKDFDEVFDINSDQYEGDTIAKSAMNADSQATIFLLALDKTRDIMAKLESLKRLDGKPEYGFVAAFFDRGYVKSCMKYPFKWFFSAYNSFSNMMLGMKITRAAFKRLLLVTIKPAGEDTAGYEAFNDELKMRSSQKPFYSDAYQGCLRIFGGKCFMNKTSFKPPYYGAYLYDAVIQFAEALHDITKMGEEPSGAKIVNHLRTKEFTGIDGHKHRFDENADVACEFSVLKLKKDENDNLNMLPIDIHDEIL